MKTLTVSAVLFDFDGTMVDSINTAYAAVCKMFRSENLTPPSRDDWHDVFEPPWIESYRHFGLMWSKEKIWDVYLQYAGYGHRTAPFYSDVRPLLTKLALRGVPTGIVSSQVEHIVRERCERENLTGGIGHIVGNCDDKAKAILEYCALMNLLPRQVAYVGDFGADVRDAKRAGAIAVGLTRGEVSDHVFQKHGADLVVAHLSHLMEMSVFFA